MSLLEEGPDISIYLSDGPNSWVVTATPAESLEWFHAIRCVRHLIHALGEDMPPPSFD